MLTKSHSYHSDDILGDFRNLEISDDSSVEGSGSAAVGAAIVPSSCTTERPFVAVICRDGDFRVWDLKTEQVLLQASLQDPSSTKKSSGGDHDDDDDDVEMDALDAEMDKSISGFLSIAAPHHITTAMSNAIDIVAVAGYEVIIFVPCRPPPLEDFDDGPKRIYPQTVSSLFCIWWTFTEIIVPSLYFRIL